MKIADLYALFERIQRDIQELKDTCARIPKDREYSAHIISSIQAEIEQLESKKNKILNLEIQIPNVLEHEATKNEITHFDRPSEKTEQNPKNTIPPIIKKQTRRY
ncbi:MAG: hypothetical protein N3A69_09705 [Leptospiraceae bacterium]|nr:hypothetical protein [Leptospiraceae bacterium]